jgi:hypothetical protein
LGYGIRIFPVCYAYCIRPYIVGREGWGARIVLGGVCGIESGAFKERTLVSLKSVMMMEAGETPAHPWDFDPAA